MECRRDRTKRQSIRNPLRATGIHQALASTVVIAIDFLASYAILKSGTSIFDPTRSRPSHGIGMLQHYKTLNLYVTVGAAPISNVGPRDQSQKSRVMDDRLCLLLCLAVDIPRSL